MDRDIIDGINRTYGPSLDWLHDIPGDWADPVRAYLKRSFSRLEESTTKFYIEMLRPMVRWFVAAGVSFSEFSASDMDDYMAYRKVHKNPITSRPVTDRTRRSEAFAMKGFMRYALREGYLARNPLANYDLPKASKPVKVYPYADEVGVLLESIRDRYNVSTNPDVRFLDEKKREFLKARNRAIIAVLVETGCRISEALALTTQDYDKKNGTIIFQDTKGDDPRTVPVESVLLDYLGPWLMVRRRLGIGGDHLFCTEQGTPMQQSHFSKFMREQVAFAGLRRITFHALRRYNTTCHSKINLDHARIVAGHKDIATTQLYLGSDLEQIRRTHEVAAPLRSVSAKKQNKPRKRCY